MKFISTALIIFMGFSICYSTESVTVNVSQAASYNVIYVPEGTKKVIFINKKDYLQEEIKNTDFLFVGYYVLWSVIVYGVYLTMR